MIKLRYRKELDIKNKIITNMGMGRSLRTICFSQIFRFPHTVGDKPILSKGTWVCVLILLCLTACSEEEFGPVRVELTDKEINFQNKGIRISIDSDSRLGVTHMDNGKNHSIAVPNVSNYIVVNGTKVDGFKVLFPKTQYRDIYDERHGKGKLLHIVSQAKGPLNSTIEQVLKVRFYEKFPNLGLIETSYHNVGDTQGLYVEKEVSNELVLDATRIDPQMKANDFWILQGGSYATRPDWILPITDNFTFSNYQGKNRKDNIVGGGLPVLDVWNEHTGVFIGSIREKPTLISLPAKTSDKGRLHIGIEYVRDSISFGDKGYHSIPTIIGVHQGDFYNGLKDYAEVMRDLGFEMAKPGTTEPAFDPVWCGWGYGPNFKMSQMIDMIPIVKELGMKVITVDYGWFLHNGDFEPRTDTFPKGEADIKAFVDRFHDSGFKVKLWITPGAAGPKMVSEHPDWLQVNEDGTFVYVNDHMGEDRPEVYEEALLCPAHPGVKQYYKNLMGTIMGVWGFDGLKMDFSFTNANGKCYSTTHGHSNPEASFETLPELYEIIYRESTAIKPEVVLEMCPCGVFPSFYKMPFYNQPVASDPNSHWQLRHRAKVIKALMGAEIPFYGDHVERYYDQSSFASMIGIGAIPGSMFVDKEENRYKHPSKSVRSIALTPSRKSDFSKWMQIHETHQLSKGRYVNLYDLAYDKPETHVIRKEGDMYYSFYHENWDGEIEFRGLKPDVEYEVFDYVNDEVLGTLNREKRIRLKFKDYLLVKVSSGTKP